MGFVQQISLEDFDNNLFKPSDILIRIFDNIEEQQTIKKHYFPFQSTYHFFFDKSDSKETGFNQKQAIKIIKILDFAKKNNYNITLQCEKGSVKSCAIADFSIRCFGFEDGNELFKHYSDSFSRYPIQHILTLLEENNDKKN